MTLNGDEADSRSVTITAYILVDGEKVPVTDEEVSVVIPRMFSMLPVGTASLDENGQATIDFPGNIPGDSEGNLNIVGGFRNHWQFATVEKSIFAPWGLPASHDVAETDRELWTQIAPTWMIITLTIMLLGVWGHYLYAIISLIRIGRIGNRLKSKAERR